MSGLESAGDLSSSPSEPTHPTRKRNWGAQSHSAGATRADVTDRTSQSNFPKALSAKPRLSTRRCQSVSQNFMKGMTPLPARPPSVPSSLCTAHVDSGSLALDGGGWMPRAEGSRWKASPNQGALKTRTHTYPGVTWLRALPQACRLPMATYTGILQCPNIHFR